jgi:hypothetical protein
MTKNRKATAMTKRKPKKKRAGAGRLPRKDQRNKAVERLDWRGVTVSVSYEPDWLGMSKRSPEAATAHLEVQRVSPKWALLPITETGYRSHFLPRGSVERLGGPAAYVRAWLDEAAKAPDWKRREQQARQLSLF